MTDQTGTTPPGGDQTGGEPVGEEAAAKGREWLAQLESMIQDVATQAAPVARQVAAKAAELTAVAAVKAGPIAQRAAEVTTDAGQKLAERAQSLASELRGGQPATPVEDVHWGAADATGTGDGTAVEAASGDAPAAEDQQAGGI